jgi:hypothetical protein
VVISFHAAAQTSPSGVVLATTTANASGKIIVTVPVPAGTSTGVHRFEANGHGPHGRVTQILTPVNVVAVRYLSVGRSWTATSVMLGIAFAIPLLTWLGLDIAAKMRRSTRRVGR